MTAAEWQQCWHSVQQRCNKWSLFIYK